LDPQSLTKSPNVKTSHDDLRAKLFNVKAPYREGLALKMKPLLGTMVIENIGGGGSSLGAAAVARAQPDGYTILLGGTQTHVNEALLKSRPLYDPVKDLDPIAGVAANVLCIAVHPAVPAQTLKEFIAYAKANPGKLSYGHLASP